MVHASLRAALPDYDQISPLETPAASSASRPSSSFYDLQPVGSLRADLDYKRLRTERRWLQEALGTSEEASRWREIKKKGENWLQFLDESKSLKSTDILSSDWVAWNSEHCSANLSPPGAPFWHPRFEFKDGVKAVQVQLTREGEDKPFYDVVFGGPPGGPNSIPNHATPAGGDQPLFPEFCPAISKDQVYVLHLKHLVKGTEAASLPLFNEHIRLKPVVEVRDITPNKVDRLRELDKILGPEPRPRFVGPQHELDTDTNGAAIPSRRGEPEAMDADTGLPPMPAAEKKVFFANKRSDEEAADIAERRRNWLAEQAPQVAQAEMPLHPTVASTLHDVVCKQSYYREELKPKNNRAGLLRPSNFL